MKVLVIGAGITGLSRAWRLQQGGAEVEVWEAQTQPGGWVQTLPWPTEDGREGWLEKGPLSVKVAARSPLAGLCQDLDIPLTPTPKGSARWLGLPAGRLERGPFSGLSLGESFRCLAEPFCGAGPAVESLTDFFARRLGPGFAAHQLPALANGLLAAEPGTLDRDTLPQLIRQEQNGGLLWSAFREGRARGLCPTGGMGRLTEGIARRLRVRLGHPAVALGRAGKQWWAEGPNGHRVEVDRILLALPPWAAQPLLTACAPEAAALLATLRGSGLTLLNTRHAPVDALRRGFSLLMDPRVGGALLGAVGLPFGDVRVPADVLQVRVYLREGATEPLGLAALAQWVPELGPAIQVRMEHAPGALPHFRPGEAQGREALLKALPEGLMWSGAWRQGPGVRELVAAVGEFSL